MKTPNTNLSAYGLLLVTAALLALPTSSPAAENWFSVVPGDTEAAPQAAQIIVHRADGDGLNVTVDITGLQLSLQEIAGGEFVFVRWPEATLAGNNGEPTLPVVRKIVIVPDGASIALEVNESSPSVINLKAAGFTHPLIPMQKPIPMTPGALDNAQFHYNAAAYTIDEPSPTERATITELGIMRGRHLYLLEVRPVAYNPARGTLTVWPHIDVGISFKGGRSTSSGPGPMLPFSGVLLNPPPVDLRGGLGNYLIIVPSDYAGTAPITQFADAKSAQGFDVLTHTVTAGTSNATIKTYIESLWGTADAPDYILLVGDTNGMTSTATTIPHFIGGGAGAAETDLPYACMDGGGDWYPDIAIGRFPAISLTELQSMVDKTILVDGAIFENETYVRHAAFMAGTDYNCGDEEVHDWVIENYLNAEEFTCDRLFISQGATTEDMFESFNAGCVYAVYFGHSSFDHWWQPSFDVDDVHSLTNDGLYPFVYSFTCVSGNYLEPECIGEAWLRGVNNGGVAFIGSTTFIYDDVGEWVETVSLEKNVFITIYDDEIRQVGPGWQNVILRLIAEYGASDPVCRDYSEMFNLLGDPSLIIPEPAGFTITADPTIQSLCTPPDTEAVYTIDVQPVFGFSDSVTLGTHGLPGGAQVDFSVNNAVPPFTSVMTVTNIALGDYDVRINGTASALVRFTYVDLIVSNDPPGLVTLVEPPSGQTGVTLTPTLSWFEATQAAEYYVEIATDPGFTNVVYSATTGDTSHTVTDPLDELTLYFWHVKAINGCGEGDFFTLFVFTTYEFPEYFTEVFHEKPFDIEWYSTEFTPDGSGYFYEMCGSPVTGLPTDPAGGTTLTTGGDGYELITPNSPVSLYGASYDSVYVNANGNLTFLGYDSIYNESLFFHMCVPRIAGVFDDLIPHQGGTISWKDLDDRVAVTYENIPGYDFDDTVTFQIEMFFEGDIHITWLDIDSENCIVGLSAGGGIPEDYLESDMSAAEPCGYACFGDLNEDGERDLADLAELLGHYGDTGVTYYDGDLDEDGDVDLADLAAMLGVYGEPCP